MKCLVDTNLLLRSVQSSHPMSSMASSSIDALLRKGDELFIAPQTVVEFWCVATRPASSNGLGLSITETKDRIRAFRKTLMLLPETDGVFESWEELVDKYEVIGKKVYDARLVAAMLIHNVSHLLTFNDADFRRFPEITVINPQSIPEEETK